MSLPTPLAARWWARRFARSSSSRVGDAPVAADDRRCGRGRGRRRARSDRRCCTPRRGLEHVLAAVTMRASWTRDAPSADEVHGRVPDVRARPTSSRWRGPPRRPASTRSASRTRSSIPKEVSAGYPYTPDGERFWAPETPFVDPFVAIPAMAAVTERIRFYTNVVKLPLRQPAARREAGGVDRGAVRRPVRARCRPVVDPRGVRVDAHREEARAARGRRRHRDHPEGVCRRRAGVGRVPRQALRLRRS